MVNEGEGEVSLRGVVRVVILVLLPLLVVVVGIMGNEVAEPVIVVSMFANFESHFLNSVILYYSNEIE